MVHMSETVQIAIVNNLPSIIAAICAGVSAILGFRNRGKLNDIHVAMNSRLDELVTASKDSGRIAEQNRVKPPDVVT
jgi:hypothetical protein